MKNKKVLLISRFSVENFEMSVELWKSYIVGWGYVLFSEMEVMDRAKSHWMAQHFEIEEIVQQQMYVSWLLTQRLKTKLLKIYIFLTGGRFVRKERKRSELTNSLTTPNLHFFRFYSIMICEWSTISSPDSEKICWKRGTGCKNSNQSGIHR